MGSNSLNNRLSLLKLGAATIGFSFVSAKAKEAFVRFLSIVAKTEMRDMSFYHSFMETLGVSNNPETLNDVDISSLARLVSKKFPIRRGIFAPRIYYKYLALLESCYIDFLLNQNSTHDIFQKLSTLLKLKPKEIVILSKYVDCFAHSNISNLKSVAENAGLKWFSQTVAPFTDFIIWEKVYYAKPRINVSIFSTMSAGKSTFINALLGRDYLPSRNEACTAKIATINDNDRLVYAVGYAIKKDGGVFCGHITPKILEEWNNDDEVSEINIEGNLDRISADTRVYSVHDTPGINYSGNIKHREVIIHRHSRWL